MAEYVCELPVDGMASFVSGSATIPVMERIVRCRDCRWAHEAPPVEEWHLECRVRPLCRHYTPDDGFCHLGERRTDGGHLRDGDGDAGGDGNLDAQEVDMSEKLKPCPFCGGKAKKSYELHGWEGSRRRYYYVACRNRGCSIRPKTRLSKIPANAIDAWNRRAES